MHVSEVTQSQIYYLCLEYQNGHGIFKMDKPALTPLIKGLYLPT